MAEQPLLGRIQLTLRIGVTGHRAIPDVDRLTAEVDLALGEIVEPYQGVAIPAAVSALAEGADRLIARRVLDRPRGRLEVIQPFDDDEYVSTFDGGPMSVGEFKDLRSRAAVREVVARQSDHPASFLAAGKAMVERSDVLMAIWDGNKARGRGGTADIVALSRARGIPFVWLKADGSHRIVAEPSDEIEQSALPPDIVRGLSRYNAIPINPTKYADRLARGRDSWRPPADDPWSMPYDALADWCVPYFARAELVASRFQRLYLWTSRLLWALAAFAPMLVATHTIWPTVTVWGRDRNHLIWGEVAVLMLIITLFAFARWRNDSERWSESRLLGERLRSMFFLAAAGVADPESHRRDPSLYAEPADSWIGRSLREVWVRRPGWRPTPDMLGPPSGTSHAHGSWTSSGTTTKRRTSTSDVIGRQRQQRHPCLSRASSPPFSTSAGTTFPKRASAC